MRTMVRDGAGIGGDLARRASAGRRIRNLRLDSILSGRRELHCEAHVGGPAPRSLQLDRTAPMARSLGRQSWRVPSSRRPGRTSCGPNRRRQALGAMPRPASTLAADAGPAGHAITGPRSPIGGPIRSTPAWQIGAAWSAGPPCSSLERDKGRHARPGRAWQYGYRVPGVPRPRRFGDGGHR